MSEMRGYNDGNLIVLKSKQFAIRCVNLYKFLCDEHNEYVMSRQILRSGTSIGANVKEAIRAQTLPDFITKMNVALKEASESEYWIELLQETNFIDSTSANSLLADCVELIKLLTAIIKTSKEKQQNI